jgi:hypothetical protein
VIEIVFGSGARHYGNGRLSLGWCRRSSPAPMKSSSEPGKCICRSSPCGALMSDPTIFGLVIALVL